MTAAEDIEAEIDKLMHQIDQATNGDHVLGAMKKVRVCQGILMKVWTELSRLPSDVAPKPVNEALLRAISKAA